VKTGPLVAESRDQFTETVRVTTAEFGMKTESIFQTLKPPPPRPVPAPVVEAILPEAVKEGALVLVEPPTASTAEDVEDESDLPPSYDDLTDMYLALKESVECKICYDSVASMVAPCGHSFCQNCIDGIKFDRSSSDSKCPYCPEKFRRNTKFIKLFNNLPDVSVYRNIDERMVAIYKQKIEKYESSTAALGPAVEGCGAGIKQEDGEGERTPVLCLEDSKVESKTNGAVKRQRRR
jgi:hypothetical protein